MPLKHVHRGYVDTPFGQVHFRASARPRDARQVAVVCLHQTASSSVMYEALFAELGANAWCFAPDTPGFGGTDAPDEPATIALYARVLASALAAAGISRAVLFGHHTGASIAVRMANDAPGLAAGLLLSGPPYLTPSQRRAAKARVEPMVLRADGAHLSAVWARLRAKDDSAPIELTHREAVLTLHAGARYHEAYDAVFDHDFPADVARVTCPTLVFAGTDDTLRDALAPAYEALVAASTRELRWVEGGNTYVCDRRVVEVADIVRGFVARVA